MAGSAPQEFAHRLAGAQELAGQVDIQMMVAAGFGVCFLPEFSPTIPGVRLQPVSDPEVPREVSLVSMSGRRFWLAVLTSSP